MSEVRYWPVPHALDYLNDSTILVGLRTEAAQSSGSRRQLLEYQLFKQPVLYMVTSLNTISIFLVDGQ